MTIVNTKVPVEVVVREETQTEYVCDGCVARWKIGTYERDARGDPMSPNSLHPPRSWWVVEPASEVRMRGERRARHACSVDCLQRVVSLIATEAPA